MRGLRGMQAGERRYRGFVLGMLSLAYVFNFLDRQILVILQESIKADMGLSDAQLGILSGFAFALFYCTFGIPIARWADRGSRRNIIALAMGIWSAMTALCGFAANYFQLLLARIGVGIGEAGASPPAHSMISDYYPAEERGRAMSIYSMGLYVGILVGSIIGGVIEQWVGWRMAFIIVGLPGVLLAVVFRLTVKEPERGRFDEGEHEAPQGSMWSAIARFWAIRSFRYASLGSAFVAFVAYGVGNFMPSFLIRVHGMSVAEVGAWFGLAIGLGGAIGAIVGGFVADRLGSRDRRWYLWLPGFAMLAGLPLCLLCLNVSSSAGAVALFFIFYMLISVFLGPTVAIVHSLVAPTERALASSMLFLVLNLIGLGLGPLTVGLISDALTPSLGVGGLRWALMIVASMGVLATVTYALAARTVEGELYRREAAA
ncbi:MAG: MFS transporter [Pseudomonadota bacterium]